ncbi:MAG: hypothetical protein OXU20_19130 [Myxococcales bacterium]|nr:hypothetical protein [Myxococcales bacterium]MDD9965363.1 hypothetical protein [Myxococcales bacterium]
MHKWCALMMVGLLVACSDDPGPAPCGGGSVADPTTGACVCPTGTTLDAATSTCVAATCTAPMVANATTGVCECPAGMAPDAMGGCVPMGACTAPMVADPTTGMCGCPAGMMPDAMGGCAPAGAACTAPMVANATTGACECPPDMPLDATTGMCGAAGPMPTCDDADTSGDTFEAMQEMVTARCGVCHRRSQAPRSADLQLTGDMAMDRAEDFMTLVIKPSCQTTMPLVDQSGGTAALMNSWLYWKVAGETEEVGGILVAQPGWMATGENCGQDSDFGTLMPMSVSDPIESAVTAVKNWICAGAPGPAGGATMGADTMGMGTMGTDTMGTDTMGTDMMLPAAGAGSGM